MCIAAYGFVCAKSTMPSQMAVCVLISCAFCLFPNNMPYPFRPPTWAVSSQDRTAFFNLDVAQADKHTYLEGLPSFEITRDHTPANQTKKVWQGYVHNTQKLCWRIRTVCVRKFAPRKWRHTHTWRGCSKNPNMGRVGWNQILIRDITFSISARVCS